MTVETHLIGARSLFVDVSRTLQCCPRLFPLQAIDFDIGDAAESISGTKVASGLSDSLLTCWSMSRCSCRHSHGRVGSICWLVAPR